jgi:outer membrane receptor protein involved in Fe transport
MRFAKFFTAMLTVGMLWSQSTISGSVVDATSGELLVGANILVKGTTSGAATDENGQYSFTLENGSYTMTASYLGYKETTKQVNVYSDLEVNFELTQSTMSSEVIVTANRAKLRETPVAFTNVGKDQLDALYTTQDVPELLKSVPGVFTTSSGLGDNEILMRGFDAEHIQIMINGIPVNDPESQVTYWSNWSGLSSSASDIQVQRGAGASLYGSGAFGGSVNIEYGNLNPEPQTIVSSGVVSYDQDGTNRTAANMVVGFRHTTGLTSDGMWNFMFGYERKTGGSFSRGTNYDGHSFEFAAQMIPNEDHKVTFNFIGAPQEHRQARANNTFEWLERFGHNFNRNNHPYQENYYFKPQFELHHDWKIDSQTYMRTNAFVSVGRGGGTYLRNDKFDVNTGETYYQAVNQSTDDYELGRNAKYIYQQTGTLLTGATLVGSDVYYNGSKVTSSGRELINGQYGHSWRNDSHSEHEQFGINGNVEYKANDDLKIVGGYEFRHWVGKHFADSELFRMYNASTGGVRTLDKVQRRYDYDGIVDNFSVFARVQYNPAENLTIMLDGQLAIYGYKVEENKIQVFDYLANRFTSASYYATKDIKVSGANKFSASDYERDYDFFTPKIGVNYNLTSKFNVMANFSIAKKEPKVGDWYSRSSGPLDNGVKEETISTFEFGFGLNDKNVSLTANKYFSKFEDKIESVTNQDGDRETVNAGNADHNGVEVALNIRVTPTITFNSSVSISDNKWVDLDVQQIFGVDAKEVEGKVTPFAPQEVASYGLTYDNKVFSFGLSALYWDEYYGNYTNTVQLPSFFELSARLGYVFDLNGVSFRSALHLNNITNRKNFSNAAFAGDFGRDDGDSSTQMYVQAAPLFNVGFTLSAEL